MSKATNKAMAKKIKFTYEKGFKNSREYKPGLCEMDGLIDVARKHGYESAYHLIAEMWGDDVEVVKRRAETLAGFEFVDKRYHLKDGVTRDDILKFIESRMVLVK